MPQTTESPSLTVDQAIEQMTTISHAGGGEKRLVIPYRPGKGTLGAAPAMPVRMLYAGFDWNTGKVFVEPAQELGIAGDALQRLTTRLDDAQSTLFRIRRLVGERQQDPQQVLTAIQKLLAD